MQKLAEICVSRPVLATMIVMSLVVVGAASYPRLGVDRFPSVDLPTVRVRTVLPGASPEEIESEVTEEIEQAVNTVEGVTELRSVSAQGSSIVIATFELSRDIDDAAQDVRDRVSAIQRNLPDDVDPPSVAKADNDSSPVLSIAITGERPLRELTELADKVVRPELERASGVGEVEVVGGLERGINVWVSAERLAAYGLSIEAVREALVRQNADVPGGNVTAGARETVLRTLGKVADARGFESLLVARVGDAAIRIRDVGRAEDGIKEQRSVSRLNGVPAVILEIRRQSGANTVAVIEAVKENLERAGKRLPADVGVEVIRDQSRYIENALHEIDKHLILGSILASLVVLLFMKSWRSTIIAAVAIPTSVVATFGAMAALGFTLNSVTMLALVLMVGVVIDDAIVVLENVFRFVDEKRRNPFDAAKEATAEIGLAVLATTFSLVVIFVPVSFMSSISGRFLYQFGITASVAVLVSLVVSFTLTPAMSARLLRASDAAHAGGSRSGFYGRIDAAYMRMLHWSLGHRRAVIAGATLVALASVPLYRLVPQEYVPSDVDEAEFEVNANAPEGTSLASMDEMMRKVDEEIRAVRGVEQVLTTVGGGFIGGVNGGRAYVRIAPHEERLFSFGRLLRETFRLRPWAAVTDRYSQSDVMGEVRARLKKLRPLRCSVRNAPSFNIGGGSWDIDFVFRGPELTVLNGYAERLRDRAPELGLVDADTTLKLNKPELRVRIDRGRGADLGVDPEAVARALRVMVGGDPTVTRFRDEAAGEDYDVALRLEAEDRKDPATISRLLVPARDGRLVRLDNLVTIDEAQAPSRIDRLDRQRQVSLRAGVAKGYAQADRIAALRQAAREMDLAPGYTTSVSGKARELERTFVEFLWAFLLSVVLMYMILGAQFESFVHPFTILLSLPLSVPFALFSLWITGSTLNLYSALGILVLFGVVKKNAILQIDHMNKLRERGMPRMDAVIQANRDRLRPILMTTIALVAGMLPLATGTGPGAEERQAVAVVVIGGQTLCLLLTLLVTPVAYVMLDGLQERLGARRRVERQAEPLTV